MSHKHIFLSTIFLSILYFETSTGSYLDGEGFEKDLLQMKNRFRRSVEEMTLQHPLRFRPSYEDRKYLLKPPMQTRRTLPFQLVTQPKTSAFIQSSEGRSYPIHFPRLDVPYQRPHGLFKLGSRLTDLRKDSNLEDFEARLQREDLSDDKAPALPTSSAVTSKANLSPNDLLSMLRGYSAEMDDENERGRMRFGLF